jgi:hypothetical protein
MIIVIKENFSPRCNNNHAPGRHSFDFHDTLHLFFLVFASKERESYKEFIQDAPKGPHIDGRRIPDAKHDLGCSVKSWLDVCIELFVFVGTRSEVNYFDAWLVWLPQQNVFWLQIAVNNVIFPQKSERDQQLDSKSSHQRFTDTLEVIKFDEFVQIHRQEFKWNDEMLAENKTFDDAHHVVLVRRVFILKSF